ncbi:MAG: hypothetical protein MJZ01_08525 [Bacteroidales bacterium]|nr:hypothetical protein [Bacteroidales bacterium]
MRIKIAISMMFAVLVSVGVSCSKDEVPMAYQGIASVERTDTAILIHFYNNTFVVSLLESDVEDSARVTFRIVAGRRLSDTAEIFEGRVEELSEDIRTPIVHEVSTSNLPCVPTELHITRDFRRLDFFNVTAYYYTRQDNEDRLYMAFDPTQQVGRTDSVVVLWLKHVQNETDPKQYTGIQYQTISVPMNVLIPDSTSERLMIHLKRLNLDGDTVTDNFVYSYRND